MMNEEAIGFLEGLYHFADDVECDALEMAIKALEKQAEIVHCKDCKHWVSDFAGCTESVKRCEFANWMVGENGFCIYGERWKNDEC